MSSSVLPNMKTSKSDLAAWDPPAGWGPFVGDSVPSGQQTQNPKCIINCVLGFLVSMSPSCISLRLFHRVEVSFSHVAAAHLEFLETPFVVEVALPSLQVEVIIVLQSFPGHFAILPN